MQWIAPSEKDAATGALETRLWAAADQLRANSGLTSAQYSTPVLGLIFLRFAEARFAKQRAKLEKSRASSRRGTSPIDDPSAYHAEGVVYLTPNARYDRLLGLPEGSNVGQKINEAMTDIEKHNPQLAGVLPRTYQIFNNTLLKELLKKVSEIPHTLEYDAFGRIYEYFLGEFARTEGQKGGEFFTPSSIVRLIVQILEPYHGRVLDPACGSGGMFVQSAHFVAEHKKNPSSELSIHGVEKTDETGRLCRMNLAIHGLEGEIRHGGNINSYYDDPHAAIGRFDFVLANPPFNVNAVDKDRVKDAVGKGRRYPFGLPRTDNANYLWIQLFYSALNDKGRAGFVMANSASDARASEQELRKQLIETHAVDVMVAVGPNMFYTVTGSCTLWFFDREKKRRTRSDTVLFVDGRHIYRQIDRAHRDWTEAQIGFLANIVRLYRDEDLDFTLGGDEARAKIGEVFGKKPKYKAVSGLCKAATLKEIEAQGWSLNPGRYVGVAPGENVSDEDFKEQLEELNEELETLNIQAHELEQTIARNVAEILGGLTMDGWQTLPLGEALTFQRGFDITKIEQRDGPYPVFSSSGPKSTHSEFKVRGPGVIIGRKGSLGTVFYSRGDFWPHDTTLWVKDFHGNDQRFAYYFLQTMGFEHLDAGASNPTLNRNHIHTIPVSWPPLPVQRRIARNLSAYDELIENNQRRLRILEEMARALYREWFVNFRFPGHEKVPLVDSPLGRIPKGWEVMKVSDLLQKMPRQKKVKTQDYLPSGALAVVDQGREFIGGYTDDVDVSYTGELPVIVFGDHTRVLKYIDFPFACGADGTQLLRSSSHRIPMTLFFYALLAIELSNFAYARHFKFLKEQQLIVPGERTAAFFAQVVDSFQKQIGSLQKKNNIFRRTRDLLLPKLISGELSVESEKISSVQPVANASAV